jgi:DNA-binding NarL/FixJ family response regulator
MIDSENKFIEYSQEENMAVLSDLTTRELEILQLVLSGKTNKAIASAIYISEKTVEFHLDHIYSKVGARSRLMASVWALHHGIEAETREIPS